jgi:hypothetical protein
VVECTALEMRRTGNRIGGSNPSLSANRFLQSLSHAFRPRSNSPCLRTFASEPPHRGDQSEAEIFSLGPFLSKPPDFARLIRFFISACLYRLSAPTRLRAVRKNYWGAENEECKRPA